MKSKFILSSAFIMTTMGAFGADAKITEASTCTVDVLGVSDNNATANTIATWDAIEYTLNPGQYLNVTETSVDKATCPSGSYCVGGTGFTVDNAKTSIATCPTGYENSDAGAGADTQCYTACTVATANIAHATAVSGNDYYGTGVDTCEPTACVAGWHVKPGLNLKDTIGEEAGINSASINHFGSYTELNSKGKDYYNMHDNNSFVVDYGDKGVITGRGRCSTQPGVREFDQNTNISGEITIVKNLADETGMEGATYCYCQLDYYKGVDGVDIQILDMPWVFNEENPDCAYNCASVCGGYLRPNYESAINFRTAVLNTVPALPAACEANTINIDWNPDNGGDHIKNMCTYEGSIELPTPDPVKPGYTFTGWKLVE